MPGPMGGPHPGHHAPPRPMFPHYRGYGYSLLGTGLTALVAGAVGAKIGNSMSNKNTNNNTAQYYEMCSFCPSCGTKRVGGATTCSSCGASLIR